MYSLSHFTFNIFIVSLQLKCSSITLFHKMTADPFVLETVSSSCMTQVVPRKDMFFTFS